MLQLVTYVWIAPEKGATLPKIACLFVIYSAITASLGYPLMPVPDWWVPLFTAWFSVWFLMVELWQWLAWGFACYYWYLMKEMAGQISQLKDTISSSILKSQEKSALSLSEKINFDREENEKSRQLLRDMIQSFSMSTSSENTPSSTTDTSNVPSSSSGAAQPETPAPELGANMRKSSAPAPAPAFTEGQQ